MMPSDRKFLQRRRSLQLEQSRYNSCVEQSRVFRIKEINAEMKKLRCLKESLDSRAATSTTLLTEKEITEVEKDHDLESLRAWSITNYGIIMERSKTFSSRDVTRLIRIREEETTADHAQPRGSTAAVAGTGRLKQGVVTGTKSRPANVTIPTTSSSLSLNRSKTSIIDGMKAGRKRVLRVRTPKVAERTIRDPEPEEHAMMKPPTTEKQRQKGPGITTTSLPTNQENSSTSLDVSQQSPPTTADEQQNKFKDLISYRSKGTGEILIPYPIVYTAIKSIRPPTPEKKLSESNSKSKLQSRYRSLFR